MFFEDLSKMIKLKDIFRLVEDKVPGGLGDDAKDSDFDPKELEMGIKHEMEHTNDPDIAKEIAKDHLTENPKYYSDLKKTGLEEHFHPPGEHLGYERDDSDAELHCKILKYNKNREQGNKMFKKIDLQDDDFVYLDKEGKK